MRERPVDVSIVIATCGRRRELSAAIQSIQRQEFPGCSWELIVVENGQPPLALDAFGRLPGDVILEWEPVAGKSRALNRGLEIARGELVVFTDDDVLVDPMWLRELWCAASAHPNEVAFCGPIVPQFPAAVPGHEFRTAS